MAQLQSHSQISQQAGIAGKEWTREDLIMDSGASDSTLPIGVLPGIPMTPPKGYKEFAMADGRNLPKLGTKTVSMENNMSTSSDTWRKTRFYGFPHRHANFTLTTVAPTHSS